MGERIEHLEDFRGFLESCKKYVNKNSKLIITTPNCFSLTFFAQYLANKPYANPEHVCWFDEETLDHLLNRHHLKIERTNYLIGSYDNKTRGIKGGALWALGIIPHSSPGLFVVASKS